MILNVQRLSRDRAVLLVSLKQAVQLIRGFMPESHTALALQAIIERVEQEDDTCLPDEHS